jgi:hypothetical protein
MKRLPLWTGALTILAWFLISNHCILDAVISAPTPASAVAQDECCPMHTSKTPAPAQPKKQGDGRVCCKNLPATALKKTQLLASFVAPLLAIASDRHDIFEGKRDESLSLCLDTGPPKAFSFSELVLQRSLLVHAPPSIA